MAVEEANRDRLIILLGDDDDNGSDDDMTMMILTIGLHSKIETEFIHLHPFHHSNQ